MKTNRLLRVTLCLASLLCTASLSAQEWAEKMFEKTNHDFGTVAKGAEVKYRLAFTNKYKETVHVASARTNCNCITAKLINDSLTSLQTGHIELSVNTVQFSHQKDTSLVVIFDAPVYAEVRIPVRAYIRSDVVLTPGQVNFGSLARSSGGEKKIAIDYAGRADWTIREATSRNPNLDVKLNPLTRVAGRVTYELVVNLKPGAPAGDIRDQVTLHTDDAASPQIPVLVEGRVDPDYVVSPDVVSFGMLSPGEKKTVNVVVRGRKPFMIEKIESERTSAFEVRLPKEARPVHVLPLTVNAPAAPGTLDESFTLTIPGTTETISFKAYGQIRTPTANQTIPSPTTN